MQLKFTLPKLSFNVYRAKDEDSAFLPFITNKSLIIALTILSILAWCFYYPQGLTLTYNDARSHLNVARRIVDNLQPGFAQIGSVWLPLYHFLELPLIWNDFFWRTGLAGSLVSMAAFVSGGHYILKLSDELKFDKKSKLISFLVYSINPNLLFMQSTPMTESLLIFLAIACVYYLVRWAKNFRFIDLIAGAFYVFLSTLTRYDGWFLLIFVSAVVFLIAFKKRDRIFAEGNTVLLLTFAGFGVALWFLWNLLIFKDPFYFALGPFSAKAQQDALFSEGRLLTKGDLIFSTFVYILTSINNMGTIISILSAVGLGVFLSNKGISWMAKFALGILTVPYIFNIVSLFLGHSVVQLPYVPPYNWFNDRYGLMTLPAVAILIGVLAKGKNLVFYIILFIIMLQTAEMYMTNNIITIQDGVRGASSQFLGDVSKWMNNNILDGKLVLAATSNHDSLIFTSGLPLKQYISEGARTYWDESMVDPTKHAGWVIMHNGDLIQKNLSKNENFLNNYRLIYQDSVFYIYKLDPGTKRLTENEMPS